MAWADAVWLKNKIITKLTDINTGLINKLNSNESNIKTAITNTQTAIINNDNTNKNTLSTKVDSVKSVVDTTKTNVDTIKSDVSTSKTNISSLTDKVTTLTSTINTINTNVNTVKTEVSEVKQSVGGGLLNKNLCCLDIKEYHFENIERDCYLYIKCLNEREFYDDKFNRFNIDSITIMVEYADGTRECRWVLKYKSGEREFYKGQVLKDKDDVKKIYALGYSPSDAIVYKEIFVLNDIVIPDVVINEIDPNDKDGKRRTLTFKYNQLSSNKSSIRACIEIYRAKANEHDYYYEGWIKGKFIIRNKSNNSVLFTGDMHCDFSGENNSIQNVGRPDWVIATTFSNILIEYIGSIPSQYCNSNYNCEVIIDMDEYVNGNYEYNGDYVPQYTKYFCNIM